MTAGRIVCQLSCGAASTAASEDQALSRAEGRTENDLRRSGDTMRHPADRAAARSRLVEIIARVLINQNIQERHESLPVRPIQH